MSQVVNYVVEGTIGVISVDNPPVNALSQPVRQGLLDAISAAQTDTSEAVVIICEGRTFIAGADITEFGKPAVEPVLDPTLLNTIEDVEETGGCGHPWHGTGRWLGDGAVGTLPLRGRECESRFARS